MSLGNQIPDKTLLKSVTQKLTQRAAGAGTHVKVAVRGGDVTLTGTIEQEHQRKAILRAASGVGGVRRVNDQLIVTPRKRG